MTGVQTCALPISKLDLSHAYQQVVLDEKSQPYFTINAHLGLYRYTRLPIGVAAAPEMFQQIIDKMLDGLIQTGGILDDLHHTFKKSEECGAKFKSFKVIPLFCTAHPLLRITLPHPRWRRFFPLARKEKTRAAFAELKLLFAIIMPQIG